MTSEEYKKLIFGQSSGSYVHKIKTKYIKSLEVQLKVKDKRIAELEKAIKHKTCEWHLAIDDLTQTARLNLLSKWYKLYKEEISDKIKLAPISLAQGLSNIEILKNKYNAEGYEGLILRNPAAYYGFGTRSKDCMIKYKSFIEAEFKVIGHRVTKKIVKKLYFY